MGKLVIRHNLRTSRMKKHLEVSPSSMRNAGEYLITKIRLRTRSGRDKDGRPFKPYADGTRPVTLTDTRQMLDDIEVTSATRSRLSIGFRTSRSQKLAGYHHSGTRRMPARPFMGVAKGWIAEIVRLIKHGLRFK